MAGFWLWVVRPLAVVAAAAALAAGAGDVASWDFATAVAGLAGVFALAANRAGALAARRRRQRGGELLAWPSERVEEGRRAA